MFIIVIADTNGQILKGSREMERETAQPCLFLWFPLEQWLPFNLLLKRSMVVAANDILWVLECTGFFFFDIYT